MANACWTYAQETPTAEEDFGCVTVCDEGDVITIAVGPAKPCFYEIAPEVQIYEEQAQELAAFLLSWLDKR